MSALHDRLVEYLAVRRALGFKLERAEPYLRDFVRYLDQHGGQQITVKNAVAWAVLPGGSDSLHYARLVAVRLFAGYLHVVDPSIGSPESSCCATGHLGGDRSSTPTTRSWR